MTDEPEASSGPQNSYKTGLVVMGVIGLGMVLTAGLVIAWPSDGSEAGQETGARVTTTSTPVTTTEPPTTTKPAPTTTTSPPTTTTQPPTTTQAPTTTQTTVPGESIDAFVIQAGNCITLPSESIVETLEAVPCGQPHDAEVYALFDTTNVNSSWPGVGTVIEAAVDGCLAQFQPFVGVAYAVSELEVYYLHPTEQSWTELGDREIVCLITALDGSPLIGSMEGSGR